MNNKYSVACITLVRDKYKINTDGICVVYTADSIRNRIGRPIRFEIRFERKKTIRRSLMYAKLELIFPPVQVLKVVWFSAG